MVFATTIHTTLVIRHTYRLCGNLSKIAASFLNIVFSLSCVFVACGRMLFCIKNLMLSFVCYCFLLQFQHSPGGDCCTSTRSEPVCIRSVGWLGPCHRTSCIRGQVGCASTTRKWFYKQCHSHSFSRSVFLGSGSEMIDSPSPWKNYRVLIIRPIWYFCCLQFWELVSNHSSCWKLGLGYPI